MGPEEIIASYGKHLQDESFVAAAVAAHGAATLVDCAIELVRSQGRPYVTDATLFIRDVATGLFCAEITSAFRGRLPESGLFDALEECFGAVDFTVRAQAAYTFGKLSFPQNASRLVRVFRDRRDRDPLLMSSLTLEARWLERDEEAHWARLEWLAEAPEDVCRWATMLPVRQTLGNLPNPRAARLLATLQQDPYRYLRDEARYLRADMDRRTKNKGLSKIGWKERRSELRREKADVDALRPSMTFSDLECRFWARRQEPDYSTDDIRAFLVSEESSR